MEDLTDLELEVLRILNEKGPVTQFALREVLGSDSKKVSRVVRKLERLGLLRREPYVENGKRTYKLMASRRMNGQIVSVNLELVSMTPCFSCKHLFDCSQNPRLSPATCSTLSRWLRELSLADSSQNVAQRS
ncbi:MAG: MarR family transcriptional regulator [Fervidicoccaceae archaeon]